MSLWDNIDDTKNEDTNIGNQDLSDKKYRDFLINNLVNYSIDNNMVNELFKEFSINLKDISKEDKEEILEVFTQNSKLLDSENSYLNNPIKGMRLISNIIHSKKRTDESELERLFDNFDEFLNNDFIKFSSEISIPNEAELYKEIMSIRDELFENIKFSELVNKTHIGIGGSFSAGKSSFLNSILNRDVDDILPTDTNPTTSIPTYLVNKEISISSTDSEIDIYTFNKDGEKSLIDKEALLAISHEFNKVYNFGLISIINKIVVDINCMPYEHIAFLDTPGYSKSDGEEEIDKNIAQNHLKNIDAMIWLIDAENGVIQHGDIKFIQSLNLKKEILFVLNKADKKPQSEIENILLTIKDTLKKANIKYVDVVAYSSHNRKEYFSKDKINYFLEKNNLSKVSIYRLNFLDIFNKYIEYINKDESKKRNFLEILNKIDLLENNITNIETTLSTLKEDIDKSKNNKMEFLKIKKQLMEFTSLIDDFFNKGKTNIAILNNLIYKDKYTKNNVIKENLFKEETLETLMVVKNSASSEVINFLKKELSKENNSHYFDTDIEYFDIGYLIGTLALYYAIKESNIALVEFLVKEDRANLDMDFGNFNTPLYVAIENSNLDIVKLLVENSVNVNKESGWEENIPLYEAVESNNIEIVKLLVENSVNVNKESGGVWKNTPLYVAIENDNIEIVELLIYNDANVNKEDGIWRNIPLCKAIENNNIEIVKLLIDNDANVNKENGIFGNIRALDIAIDKNFIEIQHLLEENGAKRDRVIKDVKLFNI